MQGILAQSSRDWTHVIVNDGGAAGPVDALANEFSALYEGRILVVHNDRCLGMEAASNLGVRAIDSRYVLIHDDDDTLHPDFLLRTTAYLESPPTASIGGVATLTELVEERIDGNSVSVTSSRLFRSLDPILLAADVAASNPVPPISLLFHRSTYNELGGFDESLPVLGDWDFLLRMISRFDVGVIAEPLARYHVRPSAKGSAANSISADLARHRLYTNIVRNRMLRWENPAFGLLVQQGGAAEAARVQLAHIYAHPVIGRFIRLWSRLVNPAIPRSP